MVGVSLSKFYRFISVVFVACALSMSIKADVELSLSMASKSTSWRFTLCPEPENIYYK